MERKEQNKNESGKNFANEFGNMFAEFINETAGFSEDDEICFSDVSGFYKLQKNGFTFLSESAVQQ